jgi:phosphonate transport system substrate-binding protein
MNLLKLATVTALFALSSFHVASAADQTYRLAITDIEGLEELQREYGAFRAALSEATGLNFEFFPVNGRTVAAEALRAKKLEFVLTGPSEYTVYSSRMKVVPVVGFARPDYFSVVAVRRDSGITTIAELKEKKLAFSDIGSTSGHIGPSLIFKANNFDPTKDFQITHLSSELGYTALKRGDVVAWCTSQDIYARLRNKDPESTSGTYRVIARGPDLPNDVLIAGAHVEPAIVEKLKATFRNPEAVKKLLAALSVTPKGANQHKLASFLPDIKDSDYDYIRQGYIAIGQPQFAKHGE